jgi:hypothetical protein
MRWRDYELGGEVLRSNGDLTLCRSDKVLVEASKAALVMAVKDKGRTVGYVFIGQGKLLVDAIVETERGAFGKTIDRELTEPFLMFGNAEEIRQNLSPASGDDRAKLGLEEKTLFEKAQNLLLLFSKGGKDCRLECSTLGSGSLFAFANNEGELDSLIVRNSRVVYTTKHMVFVSSGCKSILTNSGQVVMSGRGRSLFVSRPRMPQTCC